MRKSIVALLIVGSMVTLMFSLFYTYKVYMGYSATAFIPDTEGAAMYRIVYITDDAESPFWSKVMTGAQTAAANHHAMVDLWGSYRPDPDKLVENMEIATAARVNGIVVKGKSGQAFIDAVEKALEKGIPVITVDSDVPNSLRKSFVGPNHYQEGMIIGMQMMEQLKGNEKIGLIGGENPSSDLEQRKQGLRAVLQHHSGLTLIEADLGPEEEPSAAAEAKSILNRYPGCTVFVGLGTNTAADIVEAIRTRTNVESANIYTFDDSRETIDLLDQGLIDATLAHEPEKMGSISLSLVVRWIEGKHIPLEHNVFTPTRLLTQRGLHESNSE